MDIGANGAAGAALGRAAGPLRGFVHYPGVGLHYSATVKDFWSLAS